LTTGVVVEQLVKSVLCSGNRRSGSSRVTAVDSSSAAAAAAAVATAGHSLWAVAAEACSGRV
jgi:hypothetical protein